MAQLGSRFNGYRVEAVTAEKLDEKWQLLVPFVQKWLNKAFGEYVLTDIYRMLENGEFHGWLVRKENEAVGLCLTSITAFPQKRILQIVGLAGENVKEWLHLLDEIEDWARLNGCNRITGCGRIGWEKVLASKGFYRQYSVIGKDL